MIFKPENFAMDIVNEIRQQRLMAIAQGRTHQLDEKTSFWVVRREAWIEIMRSEDVYTSLQIGYHRRKEIMGLPVRITVDDETDVPMVQLVMEPMMKARKMRPMLIN